MLVAAAVGAATAPGVSEDVPVPGGTAALAKALEIDPVPDRARFAAEVARIIYDDTKERRTDVRFEIPPAERLSRNDRPAGVRVDTRKHGPC